MTPKTLEKPVDAIAGARDVMADRQARITPGMPNGKPAAGEPWWAFCGGKSLAKS